MNIRGFAAHKAKSDLKAFVYPCKKLGNHEVLIKISHCGICHSDVHLIDNDWGISAYPFIPGHEIIGTIEDLGPEVNLKRGQRVGVGWQAGACFHCEWCLRGQENSCRTNQATCVKRHGGFAEYVVVDDRFAFVIPKAMESEKAAPLMCAGITVFSPLMRLNVRPTMNVGVAGIGGLGHLALQFAHHFGCHVSAFSATESKRQEALKLGAHHFVPTTSGKAMKEAASSVDVLLSTVSGDLDWQAYLDLLRPDGKLVILGASQAPMNFSPAVLISDQKSIVGHNTGGRAMMQDMLSFAADHQIAPVVESVGLKKVNEAITKVRQNKVRYRMVLQVV